MQSSKTQLLDGWYKKSCLYGILLTHPSQILTSNTPQLESSTNYLTRSSCSSSTCQHRPWKTIQTLFMHNYRTEKHCQHQCHLIAHLQDWNIHETSTLSQFLTVQSLSFPFNSMKGKELTVHPIRSMPAILHFDHTDSSFTSCWDWKRQFFVRCAFWYWWTFDAAFLRDQGPQLYLNGPRVAYFSFQIQKDIMCFRVPYWSSIP